RADSVYGGAFAARQIDRDHQDRSQFRHGHSLPMFSNGVSLCSRRAGESGYSVDGVNVACKFLETALRHQADEIGFSKRSVQGTAEYFAARGRLTAWKQGLASRRTS